MIDTDKYEGHTKEWWARNLGDGSPMSCDEDYYHDIPFMETETDDFANPAIGYIVGGKDSHSLEERRANIKLMADAPLLLEEVKRLRLVEMSVQDFLDEKIDSLEFCRIMREMGVIE